MIRLLCSVPAHTPRMLQRCFRVSAGRLGALRETVACLSGSGMSIHAMMTVNQRQRCTQAVGLLPPPLAAAARPACLPPAHCGPML